AALLNYYHVIVVNPARHPDVNVQGARAWAAFVTGNEGQEIIRTFGVQQYGEPLFFPDADNADPTAARPAGRETGDARAKVA
ncbi:MAG TPA: hypothetical protein VFC53_07440, partial [Dehalococcoidia bacterium]|nr:hypothetical protein [Dehalococcoidia bacterium]